MSSSDSDGGPGQREIAYRLFAAEYDDATLDHSESDEERAPNYVVTPTGARVNRLFAVGVLTEVENVNEDVLRARVADPTGAFVAYAGQYQPDAVAFLENTETPEFVALAGKARTFSPEDSDRIYTSVRPESVNAVDADTRDRWVVSAAEATLRRVATFADALDADERGDDLREALTARGVDPSLASGISLAVDHYGTTTAYLEAVRRLAVDALEVVAGDRDQVRSLDAAPDEGGEVELGPLPADASGATEATAAPAASTETSTESETADVGAGAADAEAETTEPGAGSEAGAEGASAGGESDTTPASTQMEEMAETEPTDTDVDTAAAETPEAGTDSETPAADADEATADARTDATAGTDADAGASAGSGESGETPASTQMEEMAETEPTDTDVDTAAAETPATGAGTETDPDAGDASAGGLGDFEDVSGTDDVVAGSVGADDADDAAESDASGASGEASPTGVDDSEMYEFDEEERREIEEEFGTDFATGTEVDAPGEADIETPDESGGADETEPGAETGTGTSADSDIGTEETAAPTQMEEMAETEPTDTEASIAEAETPEAGIDSETPAADADETIGDASVDEVGGDADAAADEADETTEAEAEDVDLETAVVDAMDDIDDGDGADREAVVAAVVDEYGVAPDAAEDAIDDALMNGQCYEPAEGRLKAI